MNNPDFATIVYFFPKNNIADETLKARLVTGQYPATGPNNITGGRLTWPKASGAAMAHPVDTYRWEKIPDGGYIGIHPTFTPMTFIKRDIVCTCQPRKQVILNGKYQFFIPVAMIDSPDFSFPTVEKIDPETGKIIQQVETDYDDICLFAQSIWEGIDDNGAIEFTDEDLRYFARSAIQLYYDLSETELFALNIMCEQTYHDIFNVLIDASGRAKLCQELKKKVTSLESEITKVNSGIPDC